MYPMVTVVLAVLILRERLNRFQMMGILFAIAAMVIFSL
jgi:EamA domain-containing membrane protein RarD